MINVSKNIKKLRTAANLTQQELADRLHVTRQAVSSWEKGKNQPDIQTLELIAKELGVSLEEIIYGQKQQRNKKKLIIRAVIWGVVFAASLIVCLIIEPVILQWCGTHYIIWPCNIFNFIIRPVTYVLAGVFVCMFLSVFFKIHTEKKKTRCLLLFIGLGIICWISLTGGMYFTTSGHMIDYITNIGIHILLKGYAVYILPGILLFFGLAREPEE